ncbi:cyclin-domain-containing protein [Piedraia hortae CBS 480.64]|uniref:Cyclin-domain-containing protein n=1 Tax=Piedraia hortae CBS 480.64 TaxID=1314780 RepID=A0A6A7C881_9PEZI|nr:cyclin-domain-containing protein [Piedraia hortae CBS 480.64]
MGEVMVNTGAFYGQTSSQYPHLQTGALMTPRQAHGSHSFSHSTTPQLTRQMQRQPAQRGPNEAPTMHMSPQRSTTSGSLAKNGRAESTNGTSLHHGRAEAPRARRTIKIRDLEHIRSLAREDSASFLRTRSRSRSRSQEVDGESVHYELSEMRVEDVIEMVAGLLTKITTTNDRQHEYLHRRSTKTDDDDEDEEDEDKNSEQSSIIAFHGKNVPSITILSYLTRINKYCPATFDVFMSLLVYFDRMTERVNAGLVKSLRQQSCDQMHNGKANAQHHEQNTSAVDLSTQFTPSSHRAQTPTPPASDSVDGADTSNVPGTPHSRLQDPGPSTPPVSEPPCDLSQFFVVDSYNIHRLVIAAMTCASKYFSDIFYTNSRYAKVGGLPLSELNHLELQFLLLNDFRLAIPVEEIEAYGTMLVEFYAREVLSQESNGASG